MRKLIMALLAAALMFPIMAAPALAAPADCTDPVYANYHAGMVKDVTAGPDGLRVYAISAYINPPTLDYFDVCKGYEPSPHNGPSSWIGLQPGAESDYGPDAVLQMGITNCHEVLSSANWCEDGNDIHAFWAVKGCGYKYVVNIADIDTTARTFMLQSVYVSGKTYFRGYMDGVQEFQIAQSDPALTCWINQDTKAVWGGELFDGGDSFGNGGAGLWQSSAKFRVINNSTWQYTTWDPNAGCHQGPADSDNSNHVCDVTTGTQFKLYSVPN